MAVNMGNIKEIVFYVMVVIMGNGNHNVQNVHLKIFVFIRGVKILVKIAMVLPFVNMEVGNIDVLKEIVMALIFVNIKNKKQFVENVMDPVFVSIKYKNQHVISVTGVLCVSIVK